MHNGRNKGFTLIEVLIAIVIAALGFIGIYAFSSQCMRQVWSARELSRAAAVVEYEMDSLSTTPWSDITAYGSNYPISSAENLALTNLPPAGRLAAVTFSPAGSASVKTATVSVVWSSPTGTRTVSNSCIIAENGFWRPGT
jgi:prepilin-type N-terminal cleavage/methylation domain-containing protein